MTFNSLIFILFLAIVLPLYFKLPHRGQNILLLIASYIFYGWWDYRFLILLVGSTTVDYIISHAIHRTDSPRRKSLYLAVSLTMNLGVLGFFKYFNFFYESTEAMLQGFGFNADFPSLYIILPVGVSFYTFQSLSYTIDVYQGKLVPPRSFLEVATFLAFFPQLVAGPIERAIRLLPQVQSQRVANPAVIVDGIWLVLIGYLKKVVIADQLAPYANYGFSREEPPLQGIQAWVFVYAFAFQVYGDFAGYTDIARGLSKIMGFELLRNFRAPYLVTNPSEFWQHWHISLSTWLRDYVYIPLGGNRKGSRRTYGNLLATMLLGGLWHGAGFAYILWGLYQGLLLCIHRFLTERTKGLTVPSWLNHLSRPLLILFFFQFTCVGWLIFRAGSIAPYLSQSRVIDRYVRALSSYQANPDFLHFAWPVALFGGLALLLQWKNEEIERFHLWSEWKQSLAVLGVLVLITVLGVFQGGQFIYFQF